MFYTHRTRQTSVQRELDSVLYKDIEEHESGERDGELNDPDECGDSV